MKSPGEMVVPVKLPKSNLKSNSTPGGLEERGNMMSKPANNLKKGNVSNVQKKEGSKKKQNAREETLGNNKMKGLTPYQGCHRTCGMFYCEYCKKNWFSANSWADCYQKCNGCNRKIFPYRQFRPERSEGPRRDAPPHPQHMCQKCKQLRRPCVNYDVDLTSGGAAFFEREE